MIRVTSRKDKVWRKNWTSALCGLKPQLTGFSLMGEGLFSHPALVTSMTVKLDGTHQQFTKKTKFQMLMLVYVCILCFKADHFIFEIKK